VKGFCGGFGRRALGAWGEKMIKDFVHESVNEALKLEAALARLRTPQKIAVTHYSPIHATVVGEPEEIMPFLGSSRLEEPIDRYRVTAGVRKEERRQARRCTTLRCLCWPLRIPSSHRFVWSRCP
jgi:Icc-related predicted phosphoesterase